MAMSEGDRFDVVLIASIQGVQQAVNVFHYRLDDLTGDPFSDHPDLWGTQWWDAIKGDLKAITTPDVVYQTVKHVVTSGDDLGFIAEFAIPSADGAGTASGEMMPPANAYTFKYIRPNGQFKHGWKRFAGVSEAFVTSGRVTGGTPLSLLDALASRLEAPVVYDNGLNGIGTGTPIILREVVNGVTLPTPLVAEVTDVQFMYIGTQNTRKYGRGS